MISSEISVQSIADPPASPVEENNHTSVTSSRPSWSISPTLKNVPVWKTMAGVKSSAVSLGVPASSRMDVSSSGRLPSLKTW